MNGSMFIGTWWALVPPLLAILLAFVTKEVYSSLFIGSAVGVLLYTGFHPWDAFTSFFEILRNSMNINILIFDILLGMVVVLMAKSGGSAAYGKWAGTKIKTKRSALLATMGLGVLIFVQRLYLIREQCHRFLCSARSRIRLLILQIPCTYWRL